LGKQLKELSQVLHIYPSDANFLLVKVKNGKATYDYLLEKGIVVRDRSRVELCEGCLRITVGTQNENEQLIAALKNYLE
jgi:histidinol-phosphate aminotransferase